MIQPPLISLVASFVLALVLFGYRTAAQPAGCALRSLLGVAYGALGLLLLWLGGRVGANESTDPAIWAGCWVATYFLGALFLRLRFLPVVGRERPPLFLFTLPAIVLGAYWASIFSDHIDPYHLDVLIGIGINVILAVSLNLVNGYTGQFSLGHAGFMSVGAYMSAVITMGLVLPLMDLAAGGPLRHVFGYLYNGFAQGANFGIGQIHALPGGIQFLLAAIIGGCFAAFAGYLIGKPSLRLKGDYLALVTLGFGEIIRVIFQNVEVLGGALGLNGMPANTTLFWVLGFVGLTVFVITCLVNSTYGRGFLATHDDEIASEAVGLNTTRYKITAFVVAAFFAGIAGSLYGHFKLTITPTGFDFTRSIEIVVMVILGGMGNTLGVILAAVLLTLLPEVLRPIAEFRMIIYSLLLVVLMLVRPQGLFNFRLGGRKKTGTAPTA